MQMDFSTAVTLFDQFDGKFLIYCPFVQESVGILSHKRRLFLKNVFHDIRVPLNVEVVSVDTHKRYRSCSVNSKIVENVGSEKAASS